MTKNPILNALAASGYIILISLVMYYGTRGMENEPDTVFAPIAALSLFTLSAAVMGYLFFFQPFQMYFDGKKKEAISLVAQTIAAFAGITALVLVLAFSGVLA